MNFKFFGKKITFKIEESKFKANYKKRRKSFLGAILPLSIIFFVFNIISNYNNIFYTFEVGNRIDHDIIAKTKTTYKDDKAKEELVFQVKNNTSKVYERNIILEKKIIENIDSFFNKVENIKGLEDDYLKAIEDIDIFIETENYKKLMKLSDKELNSLKKNLIRNLNQIYEDGIKNENEIIEKVYSLNDLMFEELSKNLLIEFLKPNLVFDEEATLEKLSQKMTSINDVYVTINPGETVVKEGDILTKDIVEKLDKLGLNSRYKQIRILFGMTLMMFIISVFFYYISKEYIKEEIFDRRYYYSTIIILLIMGSVTLITDISYFYYIYPFGTLVLLLGILVNRKYSLIISSAALFFLSTFYGFHTKILALFFVDLFLGIYYCNKIKNRTDIINAGFFMGFVRMIIIFSINIILDVEILDSLVEMGFVLLSGILSGIITIGFLPYFENTFNILTDIKLLELGDFSHPLLKELLLKAPGTFNHSILVATLSEAGAESIGANSTFARVASYYHDIGKTRRPNFFVENQSGKENPHENLTPHLSSLIISSHTKDGDEIAKKYKIPFEIRNIMSEHQGTTLLAYFYNKAKKEQKTVSEFDYRYEGPKPRNKESAVIMLADSIEAAVRSMDDKNAIEVEKTIRKIIFAKIDDGQLSEAELTFKEIEIIIENFVNVIRGVYHSRIKYPDVKK